MAGKFAKLKSWGFTIFICLILLSVVVLYVGITKYFKIPSKLEDGGVHTFTAVEGGPTQVKIRSKTRTRRINQTKTVYYVLYTAKADNKSYRYVDKDGYTRESCEQAVQTKQKVERRILIYPEDGMYITTEANLTPERYIQKMRTHSIILISCAAGFLVVSGVTWSLTFIKRREKLQH